MPTAVRAAAPKLLISRESQKGVEKEAVDGEIEALETDIMNGVIEALDGLSSLLISLFRAICNSIAGMQENSQNAAHIKLQDPTWLQSVSKLIYGLASLCLFILKGMDPSSSLTHSNPNIIGLK